MYKIILCLALIAFVITLKDFYAPKEKTSYSQENPKTLKKPIEIDAIRKLPETYCVTFGSPDAKIKVVEYFSFTCPHCLALFRNDFKKIKAHFIDTSDICWVFHPVPQDVITLQAMTCFEKLNPKEKRVFLNAILEEALIESPQFSTELMIKAMEAFEKPLPRLQEKKFIEQTSAFEEAFQFLKNNMFIDALPSVEINGMYYEREVPDMEFISQQITQNKESHAF